MSRYHINPNTGQPGRCSAVISCPFGDAESDHYDSAAEARSAYEASQDGATFKPAAPALVHEKEETKTTKSGTSYSEVVVHGDKGSTMSVNGVVATIGVGTRNSFPVKVGSSPVGTMTRRKDGKWSVEYNGSTGRPALTAADAIAAMLKKEGYTKAPKKDAPVIPPKGYNPEKSEIDLYASINDNKSRTVGNLRRLSTADLVRDYNRVVLNQESAHYSSEVQSDQAARARIAKVLAERGESLEIVKYGEYRRGYDFSGPETYGLKKS